jgi:hypothetical protein
MAESALMRDSGTSMAWRITAAFMALFMALDPGQAVAQAENLGQVFKTLQANAISTAVVNLVVAVSALTGVFFLVRGLIVLKEASDSDGRNATMSQGLLRIFAGTLLVSLSASVKGFAEIVGYSDAYDYLASPGQVLEPTNVSAGGDLVKMFANFAVNAAAPLASLIMAVGFFVGLITMVSGIVLAARIGSQGSREGVSSVVGRILIGAMLLNTPWILDAISQTMGISNAGLWGGGSSGFMDISQKAQGVLDYSGGGGGAGSSARAACVAAAAMYAVIPFGIIAFIKGLLMLKDAIDGNQNRGGPGMAMTHVIAGALLANIFVTAPIIANTFGLPFQPTSCPVLNN